MRNEIGIGILDIYTQEDLENCYNSIPDDLKPNVFVASATNNKMVNENYRKYGEVPFATLRNWIISQMRLNDLKYYFILHSNQTVVDTELFEKTIKVAEAFGTWFILGDGANSLPLEEDETGITLYMSPELNSEFMFTFYGIIKNSGYFDERYYNSKDLDILDYVIRLRKKGVYPPAHYNPTIGDYLKRSDSTIQKIGHKELPCPDYDVGLSYGYFLYNHGYLPGQNDPTGCTQDQLLDALKVLQKNYAKPIIS